MGDTSRPLVGAGGRVGLRIPLGCFMGVAPRESFSRGLPPLRFWSKVRKCEGDGCWEWTASTDNNGYGHIWVDGRLELAHRAAWGLTYGPPPDELFVLHECDNRICVRPDHLFLGTGDDNVEDRDRKGRQWKQPV